MLPCGRVGGIPVPREELDTIMMKRTFDVVMSGLGIVATSGLLLLVAVVIKLNSKGPAFYRGERVGRFGRMFRILKFRSMCVDAEQVGGSSTSNDDPRITRVGGFLRRFKLDELPQLFNVLDGTMSFVGPRPQVAPLVELYTPDQRRLLDVRPGITDFASLRFCNLGQILEGADDPDEAYLRVVAPEKIRLGLFYVDHNSFWTDLHIIVATVISVSLRFDVLSIPDLSEPSSADNTTADRADARSNCLASSSRGNARISIGRTRFVRLSPKSPNCMGQLTRNKFLGWVAVPKWCKLELGKT
jgi:lipopolysaccharide/colanic/teichoic acid biosynthesis glycosyltransferase